VTFHSRDNDSPANISGIKEEDWARTTNEVKAVRRETKTARRVLQLAVDTLNLSIQKSIGNCDRASR
jgi:hypothetical protein